VKRLLLVAALGALATCDAKEHCTTDAECRTPEQACRLTVSYCSGYPSGSYGSVVTLEEGYCRDVGASCATDQDCVPSQTCQMGTCKNNPSLCSGSTPTCPTGCTWTKPFPCACVCQTCPPPP
jgi:hypothetical protein